MSLALKNKAKKDYHLTPSTVIQYLEALENELKHKDEYLNRCIKMNVPVRTQKAVQVQLIEKMIYKHLNYTNIYLKGKSRVSGFDSPLWNRVIFYLYLTEVKNIQGLIVSRCLGIDHTTGMYYSKSIKDFLLLMHKEIFEEKTALFDKIYNEVKQEQEEEL